jgi:hypothetical protein
MGLNYLSRSAVPGRNRTLGVQLLTAIRSDYGIVAGHFENEARHEK